MRVSITKRFALAISTTVVVANGCAQEVFHTVLGSLRDLTTETATDVINTVFDSQFGLPPEESEGGVEEGGNDLFVHI